MEEVIEHFSHEHPLKLQVQDAKESANFSKDHKCYGCRFTYSAGTPIYVCNISSKCQETVYLCTLCAHLPSIIENHPLHPNHSHQLNLMNFDGLGSNFCQACVELRPRDNHLFYKCDMCYFELHVYCARSLVPTLRFGAHPHLFTFVYTNRAIFQYPFWCSSCEDPLSDSVAFIRCLQCSVNYHISCYASSSKDHTPLPSHSSKYQLFVTGHEHPLTLVVPVDNEQRFSARDSHESFNYFHCDACNKWDWPQRWFYKCLECNNFASHLSCPVEFPSHPAYFSRIFIDNGSSSSSSSTNSCIYHCQGCKKPNLKGHPAYGCKDHSELFLDDSCFQKWKALDRKIHPFHPKHPLVFMLNHGKSLSCTCCSKHFSGFMFRCEQYCTDFVLDLECILLVPSLQHKDHTDHEDHLLVLLEKRPSYYHPKTSYVRCAQCKIDFNFTNCLLPYTIHHKCHFHPLTLVPQLVEDDDIYSASYCDVCEDKRDPDECIYYCEECKFQAHMGCVKFEVLGPSHNKLENVKFVTLQEIGQQENQEAIENRVQEGRDVFCLKDVLLPQSHLEVQEINNILKLASSLPLISTLGDIPPREDETTRKILYSDDPFSVFLNKLNSIFALEETQKSVFSFLEMESKVVRMGEYLVPANFEHVLEMLFAKHGDFGAGCTLNPMVKQSLFLVLCMVLQSICDTKIARVTEDLLIQWWTYFAIGHAAGFKIQFAIENLKRIVYAHFGLQADKYADGLITSARMKMREFPQEINALTTKIEKLTRKLAEKRETLDSVITEEKELREAAYRTKKSHRMRKCLMEIEDLVCYSGVDLFFPPKD